MLTLPNKIVFIFTRRMKNLTGSYIAFFSKTIFLNLLQQSNHSNTIVFNLFTVDRWNEIKNGQMQSCSGDQIDNFASNLDFIRLKQRAVVKILSLYGKQERSKAKMKKALQVNNIILTTSFFIREIYYWRAEALRASGTPFRQRLSSSGE